MKASLLVLFLLLSSALAYSTVPLPIEKSYRSSVYVQDSLSAGEQKEAYLSYKVGTVNKVAVTKPSFDTSFSSPQLSAENITFFIDTATGNYSLYVPSSGDPVFWGGAAVLGAYVNGASTGSFTYPGASPTVRGPYLLTSAPALKSTIHWSVENDYLRIDRYLSVFSGRNEAELEVRVAPKVDQVRFTSASIDMFWIDRLTFSEVRAAEKNGSYLGGWSTKVFNDGEPWISTRAANNESIGIGFAQPFWVNKSNGLLITNETITLSKSSGQILTKKFTIVYSQDKPESTRNFLLGDGLEQRFNLSNASYTSPELNLSWSNVTADGAWLSFKYSPPEQEPTVATVLLDTGKAVSPSPLECRLNGQKLFRWNATNSSTKAASFPVSYLQASEYRGALWNWQITIIDGTGNFFQTRDDLGGNKVLGVRSEYGAASASYGNFTVPSLPSKYEANFTFKLSTDDFPYDDFHWFYVLKSHDVELVADSASAGSMTFICRYGGNNYQIDDLNFDQWYDVSLDVDTTAGTYDVYIDGAFARTCDIRNNDVFDRSLFFVGDDESGVGPVNSGQGMWDDLVFTSGGSTIYNNNFEGEYFTNRPKDNTLSCFARTNVTSKFEWAEEAGCGPAYPNDNSTVRPCNDTMRQQVIDLGGTAKTFSQFILQDDIKDLPADEQKDCFTDYLWNQMWPIDSEDHYDTSPNPAASVNITAVSLKLGHLTNPSAYLGGGEWYSLPIQVTNSHPSQQRNPLVSLQLSKLGLLDFRSGAFFLADGTGKSQPLEMSQSKVNFSASLAPNETKTFYLLFSGINPCNHETAGSPSGDFAVAGYGPQDYVSVDIGKLAVLSPQQHIPSGGAPSTGVITPGADTQIAKRLVFDEQSSRSVIVKLTVWRKG